MTVMTAPIASNRRTSGATTEARSDATSRSLPQHDRGVSSYDDPLDDDAPSDAPVATTRRAISRVALVASEAASRFQREGVAHDPMTWMLAPRALFGGASALDACLDRDACLRGVLMHALSLGLDADPAFVDALFDGEVEDRDDGADDRRAGRDDVVSLLPRGGLGRDPAPSLFTATIVASDGIETVHAFHASFAVDEAEIAGRLYMRMGAASADAVIVRGFDHTSPIVEALVSQALCDTLVLVAADPASPLGDGLDLNIEQRFLG